MPARSHPYWRELRRHKERIITVRTAEAARWGWLGRAVGQAGAALAHPALFVGAVVLHLGWLVANSGWLIEPWDPYPFPLLSMVASVEAPLLALLVLMRQQRDQHVAEVREETNLQVSLHTERQTTKLLRLVAAVLDHLGVERDRDDPELKEMMEYLDPAGCSASSKPSSRRGWSGSPGSRTRPAPPMAPVVREPSSRPATPGPSPRGRYVEPSAGPEPRGSRSIHTRLSRTKRSPSTPPAQSVTQASPTA